MTARFGVAGRMLPLILMASLIAGCGQGGRQAAEASAEVISGGSPSADSSSVGAFVDGSRICIINKSSKNFQIDPIVYQERSNTTSVNPGDGYCQAGYVTGVDGIDTDLRATNGSTTLHVFAENPSVDPAYASVKLIAQGDYERNVVTSSADPGQHKMGNTQDGRFAVDLYRVDDCCGWKQWKLEIFDLPPE